jgi:anti-sigma regulatory factor (Ser/Thr protein kinase)
MTVRLSSIRSAGLDLHCARAAPIGGRGIYLVRKAAKRVDYERTPKGRNRLTVVVALA